MTYKCQYCGHDQFTSTTFDSLGVNGQEIQEIEYKCKNCGNRKISKIIPKK